MAKVSVKIGFTLRLTKENDFQYIRPEIEISEIDTEQDIPAQLSRVREALNPAWAEVMDQVQDKVIANMPHIDKNMEDMLITKLKAFKKQLDALEIKVGK
jgi:hypothetical protein